MGRALLAASVLGAAVLGAALLGACSPGDQRVESTDCAPAVLAPGELRVCRLGVGDAPTGGGRPGDWRLQNAVLDVIVRDGYAPLTRLLGAGGTVIAAQPPGEVEDPVLELIPSLSGGGWFQQVDLDPLQEDGEVGLRLRGLDPGGQEAELSWVLGVDSPQLEARGAAALTLVPQAGAEVQGDALSQPGSLVLGEAAPLDGGGELTWAGERLWIGASDEVVAARWPEAMAVAGRAPEAASVLAREGQVVRLQLPVEDGAFEGLVPPDATELVATAPGFAPGPAQAPGTALDLALGEQGVLWVRVADERGRDLWALVEREGQRWPVPPGGAPLPLGPGTAETWIQAGPAYEAVHDEALAVSGTRSLSLQLPRVASGEDAVLARIGEEAWPDADTRRRGEALLAELAGQGAGYAVLVADDEVAQDLAMDAHVARALRVAGGSRAATLDAGRPFAWPWSADSRQAAHSAAPWPLLDPWQVLAVQDGAGSRQTVVDLDWLRAAGPSPDGHYALMAVRLAAAAEVEPWLERVDQGEDLPAIGPWTWVEGVDPQAFSAVELERSLYEGRTVAGTGPRLSLEVNGAGPGDRLLLPTLSPAPPLGVRLRVEAPSWLPLDHLELRGPGGAVLGAWDLPRGGGPPVEIELELPAVAWMVAFAWGEEASPLTGEPAWVVTSPVWVEGG